MQPRVLIVCERAAERDTMRVLMGTMGCQWVLASGIEEALAVIGRERTTAALLELPGAISDPVNRGVRELLMRFPGRVIVLTDETPSPPITSELIRQYSIPFVQRNSLAGDLWPRLESMVYPQLGIRRVTKVARLVLDTFLQPLPAGIRHMQPDTRQLVYEAASLTVDLSFESAPDSNRMTLLGQIMRASDPLGPLHGVPVVLKNKRGPMGLRMTNEVGEFSFEFENERSVSLEIEVGPNDWVLILSPPLDWNERGKAQAVNEPGFVDTFTNNSSKNQSKKVRPA